MRTDQLTKQLIVSVILALLMPLVFGGIAVQVAGEQLQFVVEGLEQLNGLDWALGFLGSKTGIVLFVLAAIAFFVAAMLPAMLTSGGSEAEEYEEPSANDTREAGTVKWFNVSKGFGFITRDKGDDIFVHFRSIRGRGHRSLRQGQRVRFNVREGDKGLQAEDVSVTR